MNESDLKYKITQSLLSQGFEVNGKVHPNLEGKHAFRLNHSKSRLEQIRLHENFLHKSIPLVKKYHKEGKLISPENISLSIREVKEGSKEQILFRWWNLMWWSIPFQRAYGRQLRFIVWDDYHDMPFGLIGLQSPILKMSVRDHYLNIPKEELDIWVNKSMQAQRLGALPPYNEILGGKMVALSSTSEEICTTYRNKYSNRVTEINERVIEPDLLFITTTSAFGKSSIYNRLKYHNELVAKSLGYTKGSGTFHIPESLYKEIKVYLQSNGTDTSTTFGHGPSRKLKLLDIAFSKLNLRNYTFHNIKREYFIFPLISNLKEVIHESESPDYLNRSLAEMTDFWKKRWAIPRSKRNPEWNNKFSINDFIKDFKFQK